MNNVQVVETLEVCTTQLDAAAIKQLEQEIMPEEVGNEGEGEEKQGNEEMAQHEEQRESEEEKEDRGPKRARKY